jgi:hypothetical protein
VDGHRLGKPRWGAVTWAPFVWLHLLGLSSQQGRFQSLKDSRGTGMSPVLAATWEVGMGSSISQVGD